MLIEQTVEVTVMSATLNHYRELGYECKSRQKIQVKMDDLPKGSGCIVKAKCDYCNEIFEQQYKVIIKSRGITSKDACKNCSNKKRKESNQIKYGVDNISQLPAIKEKKGETTYLNYGVTIPTQSDKVKEITKQTNLKKYGVESHNQAVPVKQKKKEKSIERYGVECPFQSDIVKEKIRQTNIERYGVIYSSQSQLVKEKQKQTLFERYGVKNPSQIEGHLEKCKETSLERYGVEHYSQLESAKQEKILKSLEHYGTEYVLQSPEVRAKGIATLTMNGDIHTSQQQITVYNILYCNYECCYMNFPFSKCALDIALFSNNIMINIEYDAWYWHKDQKRDRRRDEYLKSYGWKILRIKSGHKIPTKEQLIESINKLLLSDRTYTEIILDDWILEQSRKGA